MAVIMFQHRFADLVASGQKRQTIRPKRKRPVKAGDSLSLRKWSDKAYRSKQVVLREATCSRVSQIEILQNAILEKVTGGTICYGTSEEEQFAKADGFASFAEMRDWFDKTHGLPFTGDLIQW